MMRQVAKWAVVLAAVAGGGQVEASFLTGTTVTSPGISFRGTTVLPFDNASATVADPAVEFTYQDQDNTDTFNFSDTSLTVTDVSGSNGAFTFTSSFTDAAFLNANVSVASGGFDGLAASISGATLTITSSQAITSAQTRSAIFTITPGAATPEPSSLVLCGFAGAIGLLCKAGRRRRTA